MGIKTVDERLVAAAALFKERNAVYGNEFVTYGATLHSMFPDGITINTPELWQRVYGIILMQMKLRRYAVNTARDGHADSMEDLSVYAQMTAYTDALAQAGRVPTGRVPTGRVPTGRVPAGAKVNDDETVLDGWKVVASHNLLAGDVIFIGTARHKIIKKQSHPSYPYFQIALENGVVIEPHEHALFRKMQPATPTPPAQNPNWDNIFAHNIRIGDTILDWDEIEQKVTNITQLGLTESFRVDCADGTHVLLSRYKNIRRMRPVDPA